MNESPERKLLREAREVFYWLDIQSGLGYEKHARIRGQIIKIDTLLSSNQNDAAGQELPADAAGQLPFVSAQDTVRRDAESPVTSAQQPVPAALSAREALMMAAEACRKIQVSNELVAEHSEDGIGGVAHAWSGGADECRRAILALAEQMGEK